MLFPAVSRCHASTCSKAQKSDIVYANVLAPLKILHIIWVSPFRKKKIVVGENSRETAEDLNFLKKLVEQGILKPVIDRIYPIEQIVEAHRYVDKGHKKGNVAITI